MTHKFYANLTISILGLTQEQYQSMRSILFDKYSAMAFVKIPNQWVFGISASNQLEAKDDVTNTIAHIITTLGLDELSFTLSLSYDSVGIGTMRCQRLFPRNSLPEA